MTQVGEVSPPPHPDLVGEGEVETRQVRWTAVLSGCCWLMDPGLGSLVENFFFSTRSVDPGLGGCTVGVHSARRSDLGTPGTRERSGCRYA